MWGCVQVYVKVCPNAAVGPAYTDAAAAAAAVVVNVRRPDICSSQQAQQWIYHHPATWWDEATTLQCCCGHELALVHWSDTPAEPNLRTAGLLYLSCGFGQKKNPGNKKIQLKKSEPERKKFNNFAGTPAPCPSTSFQNFYWSSAQAQSRTSLFMPLLCWWICVSATRIHNGLSRKMTEKGTKSLFGTNI